MAPPAEGTPVGLEVPVRDTARASSFYTTVFNWSFASSTLGIPPDKLLTFTVPSGAFPIGGAICCVEGEESALVKGAKLYLYVEDIVVVMEAIIKNGGKKTSEMIPEGSKGPFQFFEDPEGDGNAIYTYVGQK
ncbi:hypothetical protein NKR23_g3377 [Pleurostoma richardsiae]|uniref:VOC domain-containing protein n=1 Tax=Pleurostoma richardsiae TaxID=41990 RepID=A0AA38RLG2_9PEZI|nr:hypothetical protein NKR23_g3377 [Pleurostoma richardsiae]